MEVVNVQALGLCADTCRIKPLWPTLLWLTILFAIGVVLYLLAPPLAFLYAIVVGIIVRFSLMASWLDRE
jgi:hypothetical protein